jgi:hypothetical protein
MYSIGMTTTEPRETIHTDTVEFVRLGQRVCLNYHVGIGNWVTFVAAVEAAGDYNEFDPRKIVDSFEELFGVASQVEFGRESSCVMYVSLPFWSHQRNDSRRFGMGEKYTDEERQEFASRFIAWARSVKADEISVQQFPALPDGDVWNKPGEHPYRIRIWWD